MAISVRRNVSFLVASIITFPVSQACAASSIIIVANMPVRLQGFQRLYSVFGGRTESWKERSKPLDLYVGQAVKLDHDPTPKLGVRITPQAVAQADLCAPLTLSMFSVSA